MDLATTSTGAADPTVSPVVDPPGTGESAPPAPTPARASKAPLLADLAAKRARGRPPGPRVTPASAPATPRPSRVEEARRERQEREAARASKAANDPPSEEPSVKAAPLTRAEKWTRERARIGQEREGWTQMLTATLSPLLTMGVSMTAGIDLRSYPVQVPVLSRDGSGTSWSGNASEGMAVVLGQSLACAVSGGDALEHPWAIPAVSALAVAGQIVQIVFMKRLGISEADIKQATREAVESASKMAANEGVK